MGSYMYHEITNFDFDVTDAPLDNNRKSSSANQFQHNNQTRYYLFTFTLKSIYRLTIASLYGGRFQSANILAKISFWSNCNPLKCVARVISIPPQLFCKFKEPNI
ncbi:hypothetical protein ABEB36_000659 [Hypothenemus hampei]|uniref:Uncharacterized protein n=1 Tax=Hypothenemus hampei TaxID=57062 RepID=A0ABD1FF90_HYPHA